MTELHKMSAADMRRCIDECTRCHQICLETAAALLGQGGAHAAHTRLLLDCAEICQTSANFMLRGSELHAYTCGVCAEVCARCADACAQMGSDPRMQACADACRSCASSCRQMAIVA